MTPRTLWTIILKIFGLYIFLQIFYPLSQLINVVYLIQPQNNDYALAGFSAVLFSISIYLFMLIAFIFRTDWVINKLQLDKGIAEEKLELNIHRSTILQIVVIISGIFLFIESLPTLLKSLLTYYQNINVFTEFKKSPQTGWIVFYLVKVFLSFFMITSSRLIVNFIERKRRGKIAQ
jgi:hypothetical protein